MIPALREQFGRVPFGVIPSGRVRTPQRELGAETDALPEVDWADVLSPAYQQQFPSCVGEGTGVFAKALIRMCHGREVMAAHEIIDGEAIWRKGRDRFYPGQGYNDGLQLNHGLLVAIEDLGIFPPDTRIVEIEPSLPAIAQALQKSPLLQAHLIHKGWLAPDPANGGIPEAYYVDAFYNLGGHCTTCVGYTRQQGRDLLTLANTWGDDWGFRGLGVLSWSEWVEGFRWVMDGPYTIELPASWPEWQGWRKWVRHV